MESGHIVGSAGCAKTFLTAFVFVVIYMNAFLTFIGVEFLKKFHENRKLASMPSVFTSKCLIELLPSFYTEFDSYVQDHFAFRKPMIVFFNSLRYYLFNSSSTPEAILGKEGWIFYGSKSSLQDFERSKKIEDDYLMRIEQTFYDRKLWLSKNNIGFLLVIVPNKHNLYGQFMPAYLKKNDTPSIGELLTQKIGIHHDYTVNLFPIFRENSVKEQLYYKIDTHWNHSGAKLAVKSVLQKIQNIYPDLQFCPLPSMAEKLIFFSPGNFGRLMGVPLNEPEYVSIPKKGWAWERRSFEDLKKRLPDRARVSQIINPKSPPTRVLVLGDSYMARFDKYLAEAFGNTIFINLWFTDVDPENRFPSKLICYLKPDLVIFLVAERRLGNDRNNGYFLTGENSKPLCEID